MTHKLAKLSEKQLRDKANVVLAYADWWNHLKFKKGWATPLFTFNEVKPLLERAAEIVVRIRSVLDKDDPSFKMRMVDGAAREFFWTVKRKPTEYPERFIRGLVHATFKDGRGFVEGLSEEKVDAFINQFDPALHVETLQAQEKRETMLNRLTTSWERVSGVVAELLREQRDHMCQEMTAAEGAAEEKDMTKLIHHLQELEEAAKGCMERCKRRHSSAVEEEAQAVAKKHKKKKKKSRSAFESVEPMDVEQHEAAETGTSAEPTVEEPEESAASLPAVKEEEKESSHVASEPVIEEVEEPTTAAETKAKESEETTAMEQDEEHAPKEAQEAQEEAGEGESEQEEESDSEGAGQSSEEPPQENFTIRVQQVAEEVDQITKEVTELSQNVQSLDSGRLPADPNEAQLLLRELRGRCSHFTDSLLRDMTVLDSLSLSEELRPVRKTQIQAIERLVETVESITKRIKDLQTHVTELKEKRKQEEAAAAAAAAPPPQPAQPQPQAAKTKTPPQAAKVETEEEKLATLWKQLRLDVRIDVQDVGDAYVLQGYIPGLRNEDIKVQLSSNKESLTVSGVRLPTPKELAIMRRQLQREMADSTENLLRLGSGRFGSFNQSFKLPSNVDRDGINAEYSNGALRVTVPKQAPAPYFSSPRTMRRPVATPARSFGGGRPRSFMEDGDFWW